MAELSVNLTKDIEFFTNEESVQNDLIKISLKTSLSEKDVKF